MKRKLKIALLTGTLFALGWFLALQLWAADLLSPYEASQYTHLNEGMEG